MEAVPGSACKWAIHWVRKSGVMHVWIQSQAAKAQSQPFEGRCGNDYTPTSWNINTTSRLPCDPNFFGQLLLWKPWDGTQPWRCGAWMTILWCKRWKCVPCWGTAHKKRPPLFMHRFSEGLTTHLTGNAITQLFWINNLFCLCAKCLLYRDHHLLF